MKKIELDLSPNFTLEDIRKIRNHNYEMTKDVTSEERWAYYEKRWAKARKRYRKIMDEFEAEQVKSIVAEPPAEYKTQSDSD